MWSRAKASFKRAPSAAPDEEALLEQLRGQVDAGALAPFRGTSELPSGECADEQRCLLLRYLRAQKLDVGSAADRIARQAEWRRKWVAVTEVHGGAALLLPAWPRPPAGLRHDPP